MTQFSIRLVCLWLPSLNEQIYFVPGFPEHCLQYQPRTKFTFCLDLYPTLNLLLLKHFPLWSFFFFVMWWLFPLKLAGLQTRTASHWEKLFEIFSPVSFLFWIPPCLMLLTSCWSFLSVFVLILSFDWRLLGSCQNSNSTFASRMDYIQGEALPPGVCDTGSILVIWNMHNIYKGCTSALKALQRSCPTSRRVGGGCSTHSSQEG